MKLYATTTSERASKGQGGNEYIEIELKVQDRENPIGTLLLYYNDDAKHHGADTDEWVLTWKPAGADDSDIIAQGNVTPTKGKRQKGENVECQCKNFHADSNSKYKDIYCDDCGKKHGTFHN